MVANLHGGKFYFSKTKVGVKLRYGSRCKCGTFSKIALMVLGINHKMLLKGVLLHIPSKLS